ncbi:MAG: hypothetical protein CMF85_01950 [Candidatus Marinimicrobia bacterium]|nr:hypothetical protein [Candidatus Neomarinimicrobiota bacterium]
MTFRGLILLVPVVACSQNLTVSEIAHKGNTFTKDYIISREIQHKVGIPLDSIIAEEDKNRLLNLGIFADVSWRAIPLENRTIKLEYKIVENDDFFGGRFIGLGAPVFDEKTGWSFSGGGFLRNFRGRNEQVGFGFSTGGLNMVAFAYSNPWITGDHISFNSDIVKNQYEHPFIFSTIEIQSFEMNIGRYFGNQRKTSLGFELEEYHFNSDTTLSKYQLIAPQGSFAYDTRDLYDNPRKGILLRQMFYSRFDLKGELEENITWIQAFSIYKQLGNSTSKRPWILAWGLSTQMNIGIKDQRFISAMGSGRTVRGFSYPTRLNYYDNEQSYRFGFNNYSTSLELRKIAVPRTVMFDRYEFGATVAGFIDYGTTTQNEFSKLLNSKGILGVGLSFQFQGPWPSILRLDYGWGFYDGENKGSAMHLDIGHKI